MNHKIEIVDYHPRYTEQTMMMWRSSKEKALGKPEAHDLEAHRYYLNRILAATNRIYLAIERRTGRVLGMIAADDTFITQLYVAPGSQRQGIGSSLVHLIKETASGDLRLYTFEVNKGARYFWEKHGFIEREIGQHDNEEGLVDILCEWHNRSAFSRTIHYAYS
ncbi:GNAT family N-acetyltransferase [Enterovibrio norvegicus FF-454]|uniref:GNAT family N-acetyltransferase n=1 Tax=Enterovibrio norvegicus FF-454 TaxID=1185651 RepID=A0A1E5C8L7_9GAMM|nr:GNAT family N-acetyltransferase [Enterovibrio norvegicus]OEE61787.1 GNAT family N-acetyltransferase [Enterovibrio norvegicus FF-454]